MSQERLLHAQENDIENTNSNYGVEPYHSLKGESSFRSRKKRSDLKRPISIFGLCALIIAAVSIGYLAGCRRYASTTPAVIQLKETLQVSTNTTSSAIEPACTSSSATSNHVDWSTTGAFPILDTVNYTKPDVKVYALVFYGRRRFVDILDCYLRKNLVKNGGFIDQVIFGMNTINPEDIEWLETLVEDEDVKHYYKIKRKRPGLKWAFRKLWDFASDKNAIYLKFDDDLVWVHDDAIPRLVHTLIAHPEAHSIQANIVNHMRTPYMHYRTDAMHAFMPKRIPDDKYEMPVDDWRVSGMPYYQGNPPKPFSGPIEDLSSRRQWFRMEDTAANMVRTPLATLAGTADTQLIQDHSWAIAAQIHYSHLLNLEEGNKMNNYWFGDKEGIWNLWYARYSINLMAIWGHTVARLSPSSWTETEEARNTLDEILMTVTFPQALDMPSKVDTHALAAHYSYHEAREGMDTTDILDRYRAYANEFICSNNNIKRPFPPNDR